MPKTLKRGDTYPPITGVASDTRGPVPLGTADVVTLLLRSDRALIRGVVTIDAPSARRGEEGCGAWTYPIAAGDTDLVGTYSVELEVTWDEASRPPQIQTFPNAAASNETVTIVEDLNPPEG